MGRIHVLSENVANQIAAGEVVERPASVVKELLENALDAGSTRIRIQVEAGGKKTIQITDNGCGMVRDDAMLAFERHATSKIKNAEDLLSVATLGFRGEALPSIASVSRLRLETCAAEAEISPLPGENARNGATGSSSLSSPGTILEINGGRMARVEEAGLPVGTSITVRDLFFNTPARKKFLKAESTELSHIASLVTHYALAHPEKHFELHSATNAILVAPPVADYSERVYQIFGRETLDQLIAVAAAQRLDRIGLPQPPPWRRTEVEEDEPRHEAGEMRLHGFVSKPEIQKLNRNSIFVFVNGRLIRDRLIQHALTEAYRNIIPPAVFPVVLLFLEMPAGEVDVNVHPSKTEVRFRQATVMHDFVRDTVRAALMKARPVPQFVAEIRAHATASPGLTPGAREWEPPSDPLSAAAAENVEAGFALHAPADPPAAARFQFEGGIAVEANAAVPVARGLETRFASETYVIDTIPDSGCAPALDAGTAMEEDATLAALSTIRPLGQIRNSFILAVNEDGLWIVDQHVAHERVLFERILRQRAAKKVESQRLLMPIILELSPAQQAVFAEIADELAHNGFEAEPFGARSVAVKVAPAGVDAAQVEHMLHELLDQISREEQSLNLEKIRGRIAASIACHAAIKVNMPLEANKMEWLLAELAKTDHPMSCPHGRPVVLRYSVKDIQKAFKRI
ncbi:MAG TPA: DNA mismatch repair endonuclease MutL [Candidatus Binatia bacterium]|nr:DNA mismatch repair endonuclease MutL [Candidatus Binatia bacterium]